MLSHFRSYSHLYVERDALHLPVTQRIISTLRKSRIVEIQNYKEMFNRSRQDWRFQKLSQKLIIAKRHEEFLYEGSAFSPDFGHSHFYYNTLVLNCPYDCHYCYLQGLLPSANMVIFANVEDFIEKTRERLKFERPLYLCISYDTDLLALEPLLGYTAQWISFAHDEPDLEIEIRTKSSSYQSIRSLTPASNVILAWTLSPRDICEKYEPGTASLEARLRSVEKALHDGWRVRLCIDPILTVPGWQASYSGLVDEICKAVSIEKVSDISIGAFRMNREQLQKLQKSRPNSPILFRGLTISGDQVSYGQDQTEELMRHLERALSSRFPSDRIRRAFIPAENPVADATFSAKNTSSHAVDLPSSF